MSIPLSDNIENKSDKPLDKKYGPYSTVTMAKVSIPVPYRHVGLTVGIVTDDGVIEYWWRMGTDDTQLVLKTSGETSGETPVPGEDGRSAYEIWLSLGNVGSEQDFINSLQGEDGNEGLSAYQVALNNGFVGTEAEWLASLEGYQGEDGKSAYQIWLDKGNTGTEQQFLDSLKGAKGNDGIANLVHDFGGGTTVAMSQESVTRLVEPKITTKNTAFNKNFGTTAGTVAEGNHTHTQYEPTFVKNTAFNKNFGTAAGTVSEGNHKHAGEDITSGTVADARLSTFVAFLNKLADFTVGVIARVSTAASVPLTARNSSSTPSANLFEAIRTSTLVTWIDALGWVNAPGYRANGRQDFVDLNYMNPSFLVGLRDIPQSELNKLKLNASFTNNVYIGTPITNSFNGQRIVQIGDDGKRYSYWADEDNKWYRDLIGNV